MARVPKFAFRVVAFVKTHNIDGRGVRQEQHNYETLPGAWAYRTIALAKPLTQRVEVLMVIDESTPTHSTGT